MTWQQRAIGTAIVALLVVAPATAALCAIVCHGGAHAAAHCQESDDAPSAFEWRAVPTHDCGSHEALVGDEAVPAPLRLTLPFPATSLDHVRPVVADRRQTSVLTLASGAPPGSDPRTSIPSVLRV